MTRIDEETLNAYIDGALSPDDSAAVEQALAQDERLQARLGALYRADRLASAVYTDIDRRPLPQGVLDLLAQYAAETSTDSATGATVLPFPGLRRAFSSPASLAAMAASVALAIGFGAGLISANGPVGNGDRARLLQASAGSIGPGHPLYAVLDDARSGESRTIDGAADLEARPLLSFRSKDGAFCRDIMVTGGSAGGARSLACKKDSSTWRIVAMASVGASVTGGYAPASGEAPMAIRAAIDSRIAGDPLDANGEARAIAQDWQS